MKTKQRRVYTIADLKAIAEQLGGRIQLQIIPAEMLQPPAKPAKPVNDKIEAAHG